MTKSSKKSRYIYGLDSIRFLAALWVVFSHNSVFPLMVGRDESNFFAWFINGVYSSFWSGPAAVIAFFVISGFVIHYPYVNGKNFDLTEFYLRRYVRIIGPLIVAMVIAQYLGHSLTLFERSILWSLVAELIYYTIYPLIRKLNSRLTLKTLLGLSFIFAYIVVMTDSSAGDYPSYGVYLNWVLGLPCWLIGCYLAETDWGKTSKFEVSRKNIGYWRLSIFSLMALVSILRFQTPIGYPWTLNIFAIAVYFWIRREIVYFNFGSQQPSSNIEQFGLWSYSLYLTHPLAKIVLHDYLLLPSFGYILNWIIEVSFILIFAYVFFRLFEKPCHSIARLMAKYYLSKRDFRKKEGISSS